MATALRESLAGSCRIQRLFLVGVLIVLISPTLATAEVIFEDNFDDGLLDPRYSSDWGMWASQGYDGTNDPAPPPVRTPTTPGSSIVGCNIDNPFDACGPLDPPTLASTNMPVPRPVDVPGKLTTGIAGWMTLRADPPGPGSPEDCDPFLGECLPCDPATQDCYERANGYMSIEDIDLSNVTRGIPRAGVHLGMTARMHGTGGAAPVGPAILASYQSCCESNTDNPPHMWIFEINYGDSGAFIDDFFFPEGFELQSPVHMSLDIQGEDEAHSHVTFTIGDPFGEYTVETDIGTHVHNTPSIPVDHMRNVPDPGRWGFLSFSAENSGTDSITWDNLCFGETASDCSTAVSGDHDGDGDVDGKDFLGSQISDPGAINTDWGPNYGVAASSGVEAVPEPSTLSLCALAAFALWPTRRPASLKSVGRHRKRLPNYQPLCC